MGSFSVSHWVIVAIVILVLFGPGKISSAMGDLGKGVRAFRTGVSDAEPSKETSGEVPAIDDCGSKCEN